MNDLKFAFRQLLKNPGFTAVAVFTLALGIGASTAIYSVVNAVLLNPLPGPATDRLIQIAERTYTVGAFGQNIGKPNFLGVSPPVLEAVSAQQNFFADFTWADYVGLERKMATRFRRISLRSGTCGLCWVEPLRRTRRCRSMRIKSRHKTQSSC